MEPVPTRFSVWLDSPAAADRPSLRSMLARFPEIEVLRMCNDDSAVVLMSEDAGQRLRCQWPELQIEQDAEHCLFRE